MVGRPCAQGPGRIPPDRGLARASAQSSVSIQGMKEREQREALKQLWPEIGPYCLAHDLPLHKLLSGRWSIPIDGHKLRILCGERLMTVAELAAAAGLSRDMTMKIMTGARRPSAAVLASLVKVLDCPPGSLLPDEDAPAPVTAAPARQGKGHSCPGCGGLAAGARWCDACRCTGVNNRGRRCGHSALMCAQHGPRAKDMSRTQVPE